MTVPIPTAELLRSLTEVLARLAAPADSQAAYLTRLGVAPLVDELGLEFDDFFRPLEPRLVGRPGWEAALASLRDLNSALGSDQLPWTREGLQHSPDWDRIRLLAATAQRLVKSASTTTGH